MSSTNNSGKAGPRISPVPPLGDAASVAAVETASNASSSGRGGAPRNAAGGSSSKRARGANAAATNASASNSSNAAAVTRAAFAQAALKCQELGLNGLAGLLTAASTSAAATVPIAVPTVEQVQVAARKAVSESPPWVHWSKVDSAPQLKCTDPILKQSGASARLTLTSATMRGYRMARASHGVASPSADNNSSGSTTTPQAAYYFECKILPGPTAKEIAQALPPNARLGPALKSALQEALIWEESRKEEQRLETGAANGKEQQQRQPEQLPGEEARTRKRKSPAPEAPPRVGGNIRLGWSMRTGDLQAPVGYDKWSYGIRDIGGSIIHKSYRRDTWGGDRFGPGDVVGCAIVLFPPDQGDTEEEQEQKNHIRFFKNGHCMGQFVIRKGKRVGGEAFAGIEGGTYYPAVSTYLGGACRANFGPHFIYPPRKLPTGLRLKPMSDLCPAPVATVTAADLNCKLLDREGQAALLEAAQAEASFLHQAHQEFCRQQLTYIRQERTERGISLQELPTLSDNDEE